jgi:predicted RNase H-like nuclease (RuvC/YqgF family)
LAVVREISPREVQRRRKIVAGELRNQYFKESSPLKKSITEIEIELGELEMEFKALETYFATPELYGDSEEITTRTRRHHELEKLIGNLTEEWSRLSDQFEEKRQAYEAAKKDMEDGTGR